MLTKPPSAALIKMKEDEFVKYAKPYAYKAARL
jgi:hypothetical protein